MPYLDIDQADIDRPTQASLDRLLAPMLWPGSVNSQKRYLTAAVARQIVEDAKRLPAHPKVGVPVMPAFAVVLAYEQRDSIKYFESEKFKFEFDRQRKRGVFVGQVLAETIGAHELNLDSGGRAATGLNIVSRVDQLSMSDRTAERVWKEFAPVAHLWATYLFLTDEAMLNGRAPVIPPCRCSQFEFFLAYAESLANRAESTKAAPKSPGPIWRPGTAYRVSPELSLPEVDIRFELK